MYNGPHREHDLIGRSRFIAGASIFAIALVAVLYSQTSSPSLTLLSRDGRRTLPIVVAGDRELIGLDDLASAFQLVVQESLGAITVTYKGRTIVLTPDQTLASVSGRLISLPSAPTRSGRRWLVPLEFISRALAPIYDTRLDLRRPSHLLVTGDVRVPHIVARYDQLGTGGRLTIDAAPRASSAVSQDNDHIIVKLDADALDVSGPLLPALPPQGLVQAMRVAEPATLVIDLAPRFGGFKASTQPGDTSTRLVIDITGAQTTDSTTATPQAQPQTPAPTSPPELPPAFTTAGAPGTIRTIAIDPGHGGDDEGVKGASGVKEKDVVLAVARRVKATVEARLGIRVLLTRDDDRAVALDDRTALANNNKADLFVSLHANASARPTTKGAAIFCARFDSLDKADGSDKTDKDVPASFAQANPDRVPAFGGGLRDLELVPWDFAQTRHLDRSIVFAGLLEQQMREHIPLATHPTERAPLRVLESANMPAVLVELGYLSNPEQEKAMASDGFQNVVVQALYDAIIRFRDSMTAGITE